MGSTRDSLTTHPASFRINSVSRMEVKKQERWESRAAPVE